MYKHSNEIETETKILLIAITNKNQIIKEKIK